VKCQTSACKNSTTDKVTKNKPARKWSLLNSAAVRKRDLSIKMNTKKPKRKRTNAEDAATLQLTNKYTPLIDHPDSDLSDDESQMEESEENRRDTKPPPPIIYHGKCDIKELLQIMDATTKEKVDVKPTRSNTMIFAKNHDDFSKIKAVLKNETNMQSGTRMRPKMRGPMDSSSSGWTTSLTEKKSKPNSSIQISWTKTST
jgi:hypothetical protein